MRQNTNVIILITGPPSVYEAQIESPSPKWLPLEKMSAELLIFAQPKLGLRNRGSHWTRERFLLNHPGSFNRRRVRNDIVDCNDAGDRDSEGNDHSDGELQDVATHGQSPSIGCGHLCARAATITDPEQ